MSYTLNKTGAQIDVILDRAAQGGQIDQDIAAEQARAEAAEALKAPLASPALTGTPTAPTPEEGDNSTKIATTAFVQSAAAEAVAAEQARAEAAEEALQNAIDNAYITDTAGPAAILTIPDGADNIPVKSLVASIKPVQDLHGYANPWPAGGGKNKLPILISELKTLNTAGTWSGNTYSYLGLTFACTVDSAGYVNAITVNGTASARAVFSTHNNKTLANGSYTVNLSSTSTGVRFVSSFYKAGAFVQTGWLVTSGEQTFSYAAADYDYYNAYLEIYAGTTLSNVTVKPMLRLSSVSDATFAPYANICPISGWTGARVTRTGVNLWDEEWELGRYDRQTGQKITNTTAIRAKNFIEVKPSTTYYFNASASGAIVLFYDINKVFLSSEVQLNSSGTFTTPENCGAVTFYMFSTYGTTYNNDISINYPSTDTSYHAYAGEVYPVTWETEAGTVYGGTLNVTTGEMTVDRAEVDLETLTFASTSAGRYYTNDLTSVIARPSSNSEPTQAISDRYAAYSQTELGSDSTLIGMSVNASTGALFIRTEDGAAPSTGQLVYPLATPTTYQLDPVAVRSLLGVNNCWTDTGETEIEYKADLKLYIDKKIAEAI